MDYARKIGTKKDPKKWLGKRVTTVTTTDPPLIKDTPYDEYVEDRRLSNWKKWINERKKMSDRIRSITGRRKTDQIIHSNEKIRSSIETKNIMELASIPYPVIPDKYRGGPEFWTIPESLPNRDDPCTPVITMVPTKRDLNCPPDLTYVDVPELIEREKGLHGISSKEINFERNEYFKERQRELREEIELLMPKRPETKELVIQGKSYFEIPKKSFKIPVVSITPVKPEDETLSELSNSVAIVLKIQDREIVQRSLKDRCNEKPIEWNIVFRGRIDRRSERTIIFENKGDTVIHYNWRYYSSLSRSNDFRSYQEYDSPFYFNKTDGIVLQGQIVRLTIYYLPRSFNVYTEFWRLYTNPKLCNCPLIFRLWACPEETIDRRKTDRSTISKIDFYLNLRIRDTAIREIIETIMAKVDYRKPPEPAYASLFLENDIFYAKNPYHFYHPNLILELRRIYCEVVDEPRVMWDLSLKDLRQILLMIQKPELRERMLSRFNDLCKESLKPTLISNYPSDRKYLAVYNLLCSFANCFEIESEFVANNCVLTETVKSSKSDNVSQLLVKSGNKNRKKSKKRSNVESSTSTRKSNISASFSIQDNIGGQFYKEIFFIRIREFFVEIIDRVSSTIESYNRLDGIDTPLYLLK